MRKLFHRTVGSLGGRFASERKVAYVHRADVFQFLFDGVQQERGLSRTRRPKYFGDQNGTSSWSLVSKGASCIAKTGIFQISVARPLSVMLVGEPPMSRSDAFFFVSPDAAHENLVTIHRLLDMRRKLFDKIAESSADGRVF